MRALFLSGVLSGVLALVCGCHASSMGKLPEAAGSAAPVEWVIYPGDGEKIPMEDWIRDHPMPADAGFSLHDLSRSESSSSHIVQIRKAEALHTHEHHDLIAIVQKGHGILRMASRELRLGPGSVVMIPRGTPHSFVNESPEPAVAFVVFSPPFDGEDTVPVSE